MTKSLLALSDLHVTFSWNDEMTLPYLLPDGCSKR